MGFVRKLHSRADHSFSGCNADCSTRRLQTTSSCLLRKSKLQKSVTMQLNGYVPLHIACLHSNIEVIKLLLKQQADVNMKDSTNRTPLHYATSANRPDVVNICIENGSDVNCQTSSGKTALMLAVQEKNVEIVRALLTAGADVTLTDVKKGTALEISLLSGGKREKAEIVRALLQAGSDPNTENPCKCTPLIIATSLGQLDVINLLLDSGANINHEDNRGKTAFHMSCEHTRSTQKNTSRLLISRGADVNHKDGSGKSPLDLAVQYNKIGTVVFLLQMDCLRNSDFMECDKTREMCKKYPQVNFFLEHEFRQPWSLLRLCRFMIRNSVEPDKLKDIQHIPNLPKTLLKYLTFSGVEFI
ncbi:putative ankyrin repeat protein RF_0381 isoform X2 [Ostrea edulis]|uniref:putative ankyrin repeat protein RF_0381 isoform X2 n=1 Tax=Ostrea edulis TaxID=37623 RepID=UPI002094C295|nr:putative ankyrin repeat protein RF_0381 isoform X2 [Ostrea edulis]